MIDIADTERKIREHYAEVYVYKFDNINEIE